MENDFLTYWNEAEGEDIDEFWKRVYLNNARFQKKRCNSIRLKIKDIHEYNSIPDKLAVAEQLGQINTK